MTIAQDDPGLWIRRDRPVPGSDIRPLRLRCLPPTGGSASFPVRAIFGQADR